MAESPKDYSDYLSHISNIIGLGSLFTGFLLTIITLLLTQLPSMLLNSALTQGILFYLSFLFYLWLFLVTSQITSGIFLVRQAPPMTKQIYFNTINLVIATLGIGSIIPLLFLLWNLVNLALVSAVIWIIFSAISTISFVIPYKKLAKLRK